MNGEPSTSKRPRPNHNEKDGKRPYRHHNHQPKDDAGATGISKLKASLRQTRRLLAKVRNTSLHLSTQLPMLIFSHVCVTIYCAVFCAYQDTLAPNVRVQTERRLKSLEGDLARAELASKERTMAVKYHRVKFFGASLSFHLTTPHRGFLLPSCIYQLVDRQKITRKIRQIKKQLSDPSLTSKKERKNLEETLFSLRVDLNYVLVCPFPFDNPNLIAGRCLLIFDR